MISLRGSNCTSPLLSAKSKLGFWKKALLKYGIILKSMKSVWLTTHFSRDVIKNTKNGNEDQLISKLFKVKWHIKLKTLKVFNPTSNQIQWYVNIFHERDVKKYTHTVWTHLSQRNVESHFSCIFLTVSLGGKGMESEFTLKFEIYFIKEFQIIQNEKSWCNSLKWTLTSEATNLISSLFFVHKFSCATPR